ncbi:helix-turn-helix domain-containing protein [Pedobacter sp. GR22-6]|uniref:helix-turn-helix domain-containing protein n=1 Tax=Pedobacter sp. GR22-6 TaxID=3127957 RepID=UPI00307DFC19
MQYIIAIGIFQALMVGGILWKNKLRSGADSLLILLVACIASHLAIKFVIYNFVEDLHVREQMNTFIGYCYGPLLYLFSLKVRDDRFIPASKWYVFLPFVLGAIAYFSIAGALFASNFSDYRLLKWYNDLSTVTMLASEFCFIFFSLSLLKDISDAKKREKRMVKKLAYLFLSIALCSLCFFTLGYFYEISNMLAIRSLIYAMLTAICIQIGYYSVFQEQTVRFPAVGLEMAEEKAISKKAPLSPERQQEIWNSLEHHLQEYKTFTDSELSLDKLALATGINKYHISETLNSFGQCSFYQYINEHRIQYAIKRMQRLHQDETPVNVLSLAYDAGFKAKSSFNKYFKEITGFTPTEHLRSLN